MNDKTVDGHMEIIFDDPLDCKRMVSEALLRKNYFPNQKGNSLELPPCFSTTSFTPEVAEKLCKLNINFKDARKVSGFDCVSYNITRHNNVPRCLSLIHPYAYAKLANHIVSSWSELKERTQSKQSIIKPYAHADGRLIIMNYESGLEQFSSDIKDSAGCNFRAHADITNFYHSIYTHSVEWAALGFDEAKARVANKKQPAHWSKDLDSCLAWTRRGETQGVAIGPSTSNIVVELILGKIDSVLESKQYRFKRYIDDYICYCQTHEEATNFIRDLGVALSDFRLSLNIQKTKIVTLPEPISDTWVFELEFHKPKFILQEDQSFFVNPNDLVNYFNHAVRLNKATPEGSVIKYAISSILHLLNSNASKYIADCLINLSWHYPILIPYIEKCLEHIDANDYVDILNKILTNNAENRRSDGMAWILYAFKKYDIALLDNQADLIIESKDCISILSLYRMGSHRDKVADFCNSIIATDDTYHKDRYWILLYQLYKDKLLAVPYIDGIFDILISCDVDFIPDGTRKTKYESYCDYFSACNMFGDLAASESFDTWDAQN